uniref:Uncharacterized protein n=1 Tax=Arundo donax TaxID=35708 RepID=A0A0A9G5Q6_ARUDO
MINQPNSIHSYQQPFLRKYHITEDNSYKQTSPFEAKDIKLPSFRSKHDRFCNCSLAD